MRTSSRSIPSALAGAGEGRVANLARVREIPADERCAHLWAGVA
ncbi:MAG: hypothetical protein U0414_43410 [Polyangiaceae bacterium]